MSSNMRSIVSGVTVFLTLGLGSYVAAQTDVVYVESNRADHNSILIYQNVRGALIFVREVPTSGRGVFDLSLKLGPFDSDQDVVRNAEGTVLYAVNSGSDTVAAFRIAPNGDLAPLSGSPFSSGGTNPVSVAISRDTLVVVNKAMDPSRPALNQPSYTSFSLDPQGRLESGPISSYLAPVGSSPSQADISSGKRLVFDAQFLGGHLQSLLLQHDGSLIPEDSKALPASVGPAPRLPLGLWAHPSKPILFVGFVTLNKLGVYTFDSVGHLHFAGSFPNSGKAICWLRTNAKGTRLYTANTTDNSISVYDITSPLRPMEIEHLKLQGRGNALQFTLSPSEDYLYVVTQRGSPTIPLGKGNTLHVLKVHQLTGRVSEASSSHVELPVPTGTRPQGIAAVQIRRGDFTE